MPEPPTEFNLTSGVFRDGASMPVQYTCRGQNVSPPLVISKVPKGAASLALVVRDPDAIPVVGHEFTHWLMWDIPTSTDIIPVNSVPTGAVQGQNDAGSNKYVGPCPPAGTGTHHYIFELYALDKSLSLPPNTKRDDLEAAMTSHILAKAVLTGTFDAEDK